MNELFRQSFPVRADLSEVGRMQEELSLLAESGLLPPEIEGTISLALEEILSNVIRHGAPNGSAPEIAVLFSADEAGFEFEVSDTCAAYNPLEREDPDTTLSLEERRPGGLGVFLVKRLADELTYSYRDGRNHMRFRKLFLASNTDSSYSD